jgi:hypothetical protein
MSRDLGLLLLVALGLPITGQACSCRGVKPACAYIEADTIFLGRVSFTNDDGSGSFNQATLVRFDVEEHFKGIPATSQQVWIDPGSFSSCYKEYKLGERYLIMAGKGRFPSGSAAMSFMRNSSGKAKPLPNGFDAAKHPVYYAPECSGSRIARDFPKLDQDLAMLRAYLTGSTLPRVLGHVYLYPFRGWPLLSGPKLRGARVTMVNDAARLLATTDSNGDFSLPDAPAGYYKAWAELPPYRAGGPVILSVPKTGCGYTDIEVTTTSSLQGVVIDAHGRLRPEIPVHVRLKRRTGDEYLDRYGLETTTDQTGQFIIRGLPDEDLFLSAGSDFPTTEMPYRRVYYPAGRSQQSAAVLRLQPGDHPSPLVLTLEEALIRLAIDVQVVHQGGEPVPNARVQALDNDGVIAESAKTDRRGMAKIPCLRGQKYELEAQTLHERLPWRGDILKSSRSVFTCSDSSSPSKLTLDHMARW